MKFLFLVRRYNDIDHITPIVYRMAKEGIRDLEIFCLNPRFDLNNDFRLKFLKETYQLKIDYIYNAHYPTMIHRILAYLICGALRPTLLSLTKWEAVKQPSLLIPWGFNRYLYNFFYEKLVRHRFFGERWAISMLGKKQPSVIVIDGQKPKQYNVVHLIKAAKFLKIPLLAVPHGMTLMTNEFVTWQDYREKNTENYQVMWKDFKHNIVQFEQLKQRVVARGVDSKDVTVLGSTRYCAEWKTVYEKILPPCEPIPHTSDHLKLVFMDHSYNYRIHKERVLDTIQQIQKLGFVNLIIKPSTSAIGTAKKGGFSSAKALEIAKLGMDLHSIDLIRWADVVMCTTSSISLEVLLHKKVLLYPKYFHENTMFFEEMGACWQVNNYSELEQALLKLRETPQYRPYTDENVKHFLTEVIEGGIPGRDVLGEYIKFITEISQNNHS